MVFFSACATAPEPPTSLTRGEYGPLIEYFREAIPYQMERNDVTGLSVAVVDGDQLVWAEGFGYSDAAAGVAADADTAYIIGSITKLFTATALMQLVEKGRVDLDAPVSEYLPELHIRSRFDNAGPIRVRHLMTHHSGLPGDKMKGMFGGEESFRDLIEYLNTQYVCFPPDFVFAYSNLAVNLMGIIVERVSGRSFEHYVRDEILDPLAMRNSEIFPGVRTEGLRSKAYSGGEERAEYQLRGIPAGNLWSTVTDMGRFASWVLTDAWSDKSPQILAPLTLAEMLTPQNDHVVRDLGKPVGLNWMLSRDGLEYAGAVAWHNGGTLHFMSTMVLLQEHELGVILLSNSDTGGAVTEPLANEILAMALEVKAGITPESTKGNGGRQSEATTAAEYAEQHAALPGRYATPIGVIECEARRDSLVLRFPGQPKLHLVPGSGGWLRPEIRLLGFIPLRPAALGQVQFRAFDFEGARYLAIRAGEYGQLIGSEVAVVEIPQSWRNALGAYRVTNPDPPLWGFKSADLEIADGVLRAIVDVAGDQQFEFLLKPVSDCEAVIQGIGRNTGDTVFLRPDESLVRIEAAGYVLERQ